MSGFLGRAGVIGKGEGEWLEIRMGGRGLQMFWKAIVLWEGRQGEEKEGLRMMA